MKNAQPTGRSVSVFTLAGAHVASLDRRNRRVRPRRLRHERQLGSLGAKDQAATVDGICSGATGAATRIPEGDVACLSVGISSLMTFAADDPAPRAPITFTAEVEDAGGERGVPERGHRRL